MAAPKKVKSVVDDMLDTGDDNNLNEPQPSGIGRGLSNAARLPTPANNNPIEILKFGSDPQISQHSQNSNSTLDTNDVNMLSQHTSSGHGITERSTTFVNNLELAELRSQLVKRSSTTNLQMKNLDTWRGCCHSLWKTENDLFGFSIIWLVGMIVLLVLYFKEYDYMVENDVDLSNIFVTPIVVGSITWVFSWSITRFQKPGSKEAVNKARFLVPFVAKVFTASSLFFWLFFTQAGIYDRIKEEDDYSDACWYSIADVFGCLVLSLCTTELMITTVMVNAAQNLRDDIPYNWSVFLFFTRPLVWVYNRTICMFISFYIYFAASCSFLGVGTVTLMLCSNDYASSMYQIGIKILLAPFINPLYLFEFHGFDYRSQEDDEIVTTIIQQVLLWTTIVDVVNSLYVTIRYLLFMYKSYKKGEMQRNNETNNDNDNEKDGKNGGNTLAGKGHSLQNRDRLTSTSVQKLKNENDRMDIPDNIDDGMVHVDSPSHSALSSGTNTPRNYTYQK